MFRTVKYKTIVIEDLSKFPDILIIYSYGMDDNIILNKTILYYVEVYEHFAQFLFETRFETF